MNGHAQTGVTDTITEGDNEEREWACTELPNTVAYNTVMMQLHTRKLKIFNKNYKGLGTTEKEKKQEETQTGR